MKRPYALAKLLLVFGASAQDCVTWDLALPAVPPEVAFRSRKQPDFVSFDAQPAYVASYWSRIQAAVSAAGGGAKGLYGSLGLRGNLTDAIRQTLAVKASRSQSGLFVLLRGDSHLRITLNMLALQLSHDPAVNKKAEYNRMTYHLPHLFCCRDTTAVLAGGLPGACNLEIADPEHSDDEAAWKVRKKTTASYIHEGALVQVLSERVGAGEVCLLWQPTNFFAHDVGVLATWQAPGIAFPDLIIVDGGAHYHDFLKDPPPGSPLVAESMANYNEHFHSWLSSASSALGALPESSLSTMVLVSSPRSSFSAWHSQLAAYETMRTAVANMPAAARRRTSYLDLHSLWAIDKCGFSTKFPNRIYRWFNYSKDPASFADTCGHHCYGEDQHLMGGAYMHSAELEFNLLRLQAESKQRRCDPPPHVSSEATIDDLQMSKSSGIYVYCHGRATGHCIHYDHDYLRSTGKTP